MSDHPLYDGTDAHNCAYRAELAACHRVLRILFTTKDNNEDMGYEESAARAAAANKQRTEANRARRDARAAEHRAKLMNAVTGLRRDANKQHEPTGKGSRRGVADPAKVDAVTNPKGACTICEGTGEVTVMSGFKRGQPQFRQQRCHGRH